MCKKSYFIDAVIGNSKMLVSMYRNGVISRLWWPHIDLEQHANNILDGVYVENTKEMIWRNQEGWRYFQKYITDTNILQSTAIHHKTHIEIETIDFCLPKEDILVRKYTIKNLSSIPMRLKFIFKSSFSIGDSTRDNVVYFDKENKMLIHYKRKYVFAVGSSEKIFQYTASNVEIQARFGKLDGNHSALGTDGAFLFNLEELKKNEEKTITIFISMAHNKEMVLDLIRNSRAQGVEKLYNITENYWHEYLYKGKKISIENKELNELYKRSLLVIALMNNRETGGFLAAPEFDEDIIKCGGYGFCWPRDGTFIAHAMLKAGYIDMSKNFYNWALNVQEKEGFWDQRYYMNGFKAPTWGVQIDETGSIIWGIYEYYKVTHDENFIKKAWKGIYKAAEFLCENLDKETKLPIETIDLWEERRGEHTYSSSAVEAGLRSAAKIARVLGFGEAEEKWHKVSIEIKDSIENTLWNKQKESFYRGIKLKISKEQYYKFKKSNAQVYSILKDEVYEEYIKYYDDIVDASLLGISYPFETFRCKNEKMIKQANSIEKYLWVSKVGGLKRYENDIYIGGNPWIITTLWLAIYYSTIGNTIKATTLIDWVVKHKTSLNLLPEQIHKKTGETAWVIPLTWSHAMLILAIIELKKNIK